MARLLLIFFFMASPVYSWTMPEPRGYWIVSEDASTLYGASDFHGNYKIGQWSIPDELPAFENDITENDHMRVVWDKKFRTTTLTLRGNDLPCNDELDGYISPLAMEYSDYLNKYKRIRLHVSIKREDVFISSFGCDITQGGDLVGIIFFNEKSRQKLFYQLRFSNIRMNPDARYWWRNGMRHPDGWVSWGYRDQLRTYDEDVPGVGLWEIYDLNLTRRIKKLIKTRPGMDDDLSHWKIRSVFYGSHIWGDMEISTSWKNVRLIAK
jgi:hypothetical protein